MFALVFTGCLLGLVVMTIWLWIVADSGDNVLAFIGSILCGLASVLGLLVGLAMSFDWFAADHKARILNSEYGTSYTREDVFYASSVIDTIRQLNRQRIEVNGDLMQEKKTPR